MTIESQHQFLLESQYLCRAMEHLFSPDKMNIATLGNTVPQLHIHHVARYISDAAWPDTIWDNACGEFRNTEQQSVLVNQLQRELRKDRAFHFQSA